MSLSRNILTIFVCFAAGGLQASVSVKLTSSIPSPAPLGYTVTWTAAIPDSVTDPVWYRFRTRYAGTDFQMVRDFGPVSSLDWTSIDREGVYEVEVSVQNKTTGETGVSVLPFEFFSNVMEGKPVINETINPLVFLYSAPPCPEGSRMRVQFQSKDGFVQNTPYKPCQPNLSMNFYLAGMRQDSLYSVKHIVTTGAQSADGPAMALQTPPVSIPIAGYTVLTAHQKPAVEQVLLQSTPFQYPVATDLEGNLLWYYPVNISIITRAEEGGYFFGLLETPFTDPAHQVFRKFDLTGSTILETNAARINEQLAAAGKHQINSFHHEVRHTRDGKIIALASEERILTDVQGDGPVNVLGDVILAMDSNLQVVWSWDSFDHLDPHRLATLNDNCGPVGQGCSYFYQTPLANDWLHGNSLQETPDGDILYSARNQDWVIKIDYKNAQGTGGILWRLGKDGDFQIDSTDPDPWFSHQHDPQFEFTDRSTLTLLDNGNTRYDADPTIHSRGQVLQIDEQNRTANLVFNVDLGTYSFALGAAQRLPNGNYHFLSGWPADGAAQSLEFDPSGNVVYAIQTGSQDYRTFRMRDLYTP